MTSSIRKALLRGVGFAAASGALIAGPVFAAETAIKAEPSQAAALEIPAAEQQISQAAPEVAQGYGTPVVAEVIEVDDQAEGFYVTIGGGFSDASDMSYRTSDIGFTNFNGDLEFGGGFSGDVGIGYDFGAIRTELTYVYSRGSVNGISASANNIYGVFDTGTAQTNSVSGIINKSDVMGSVYLDIPTGTRFVPYIGGGIGYTNISTPSFTAGGYRTASANKGLLGWQGKVGVSYVASYNFDVYAEGVYQGASSFYTGDVHYGSYNSWGAKAGFRYRFGAREEVVVVEPAPAPAPEPAPPAPEPAPMPAPMPAPEPIRGLW